MQFMTLLLWVLTFFNPLVEAEGCPLGGALSGRNYGHRGPDISIGPKSASAKQPLNNGIGMESEFWRLT